MKNKNSMYGAKELGSDEFSPEHTSVRISMMIEGDLLAALKKRAAQTGIPYQALMKNFARQALASHTAYRGDISDMSNIDRPTSDVFSESQIDEILRRLTLKIEPPKKRKA